MTDWQELTTQQMPDAPVFPDCAVTALPHFGLIRISGPDSREFLQGQLTNDINKVTTDEAQLSSYCSPKGRMLASFLVFQRGEDLFLQLPRERLEATLKRLSMFVLRAQVQIEDASDSLPMIGLAGECVSSLLPDAPAEDWQSILHDDVSMVRLPGDRLRLLIAAPKAAMPRLWSEIQGQAQITGPDFWTLMDIRAGMPVVFEPTVEAFVPQMANLQLVNGVSFTKGCYTGQEVVARMQYLGKLKRRMYRVRMHTDAVPDRGAELFSPSSESGQGTGRIVQAAAAPDGSVEALAVLQISSAESDDVHLSDAHGPRLELLDLPYEFEPQA